jgi:hypothetical protein
MKTEFSYDKAAYRPFKEPEILPYTRSEFYEAVYLYSNLTDAMQQALAEVMWQDAINKARWKGKENDQ